MKVYDVEILVSGGEICIRQESPSNDPQVIILAAEQAGLFCEMIRAVVKGIDPEYPWWVSAGYGDKKSAIAAGVCEG